MADKKFLSDVINYKEDIEPYKLIQIYSGVGSGKNTWVMKEAQNGKSILFITSRKTVAEKQSKDMGTGRFINIEDWHRNTFDGKLVGKHQYLVSCTNSGLESFIKNKYDPDRPLTHIWNFFDLIIVDEAHSLITDAAFASSSFQVWRFILWVTKQKDCACKVILMSGTPRPLESLIPDKARNDERFNYINYYEQCNHVDPKEVIIHRGESMAIDEIVGFYNEGKRVIYFTKHIRRISKLVNELNKRGIKNSEIGISYSNRKRDKLFETELVRKVKIIDDSIRDNEMLPNDVKIFITNTKNKEGINIKNDDIKIMLAESMQHSELVQMAGRVRNGLDKLIIMTNIPENKGYEDGIDIWKRYLSEQLFEQVVNTYKTFIANSNYPDYTKIIADIEKCFPYMKYDYFQREFVLFRARILEEELTENDNEELMDNVFRWGETEYYADTGEIVEASGAEDFQKWFPYSDVYISREGLHERLPLLPPDEDDEDIVKNIIDEYLKENNLIREKIHPREKDKKDIRIELTALIQEKIPSFKSYDILPPLLKHGGYGLKTHGNKTTSKYSIYPLPNDKEESEQEAEDKGGILNLT